MQIVLSDEQLIEYVTQASEISSEKPILIDRYLVGKEVEVDVICDGKEVIIPGIMEHIERSGVHSGDSMAVYPPQHLSQKVKEDIIDISSRLALGMNTLGMMNIQFVIQDEIVYVIEVNPRASRTVPFLSKVTNIPMANVATQVILGKTLKELGYDGVYSWSARGFAAPKGTDPAIIAVLTAAIERATKNPEHMKKMAEMGLTLDYQNPDGVYKSLKMEEQGVIGIKDLLGWK